MNKVKVEYYSKKVILKKIDEKVELPEEIKKQKEEYWEKVSKENPYLFNGIIYDVDNIINKDSSVLITLKETDFAHYLYGQKCNNNYICKNCWAGFIIETSDNYYVFGKTSKMAPNPETTHMVRRSS